MYVRHVQNVKQIHMFGGHVFEPISCDGWNEAQVSLYVILIFRTSLPWIAFSHSGPGILKLWSSAWLLGAVFYSISACSLSYWAHVVTLGSMAQRLEQWFQILQWWLALKIKQQITTPSTRTRRVSQGNRYYIYMIYIYNIIKWYPVKSSNPDS